MLYGRRNETRMDVTELLGAVLIIKLEGNR